MSGTETVTVERQGLTLSSLLWRKNKMRIDGLVERCLALNPGLSANLVLPVGMVVTMPILSAEEKLAGQEVEIIQLFN
ncbi:tail protein X [uncultured Cohaesibacter sp.]|uniref:tail protein X n=1 Tax=uncultured Cohaesibacter sp. TaxID=1002546 RepID=UPI0029C75E04|nr:tail protein X [uncultured Cohaesibacter sp.]